MRVIDPGHEYELDSLDGEQSNRLIFVKREGAKYPGNIGHHSGTTMQDVLRAIIDRAEYVNAQIYDVDTEAAIQHMKIAIYVLERRAAARHGRAITFTVDDAAIGKNKCKACGHIGCNGGCLASHSIQ